VFQVVVVDLLVDLLVAHVVVLLVFQEVVVDLVVFLEVE
jgi:hypothetical protein